MSGMIKVLRPPKKDAAYLRFDVKLEPGESAEVRPSFAFRCKRPLRGKSSPYLEVPLVSVSPFRTSHFSPSRVPAEQAESSLAWSKEAGIWFTSICLSDGNGLEAPTPAWRVSHFDAFPTSMMTTDISFVIENRGTKPVRFTGQIDGATLSEPKR
jgi:hypothetical protein